MLTGKSHSHSHLSQAGLCLGRIVLYSKTVLKTDLSDEDRVLYLRWVVESMGSLVGGRGTVWAGGVVGWEGHCVGGGCGWVWLGVHTVVRWALLQCS